jgi:hypothetical protein
VEITETIARKVVAVVDAGLVNGKGRPIPGQMCVEAAVCFAMGLPHGDNPSCVSPALRRLKIGLNDRAWSSDQARAKGLRRLAVAQLGSAGVLDDRAFMRRVAEMTIRKAVPIGLRAAAKMNPKHAEKLDACAVRCETEGTRESCDEARAVARAAAYAAYAAYAAAAYAAADAAYAAYAAYAADDAAYAADAAYARASRSRDAVLSQYAEWVVEILIDMHAPGCQWLTLTPKEEAA